MTVTDPVKRPAAVGAKPTVTTFVTPGASEKLPPPDTIVKGAGP